MDVLMAKFIPSYKKRIRLFFRSNNGLLKSKLIQPTPGKNSVTIKSKGSKSEYFLTSKPDIYDLTNQRCYVFKEGTPYPIDFEKTSPEALQLQDEVRNFQLVANEMEQAGYEMGSNLNKKKKENILIIAVICSIANVFISLGIIYMIMKMGGGA